MSYIMDLRKVVGHRPLLQVEPSEEYAEQIAEYKQAFLDADSSMDGCGPLRRCEDPLTYISECRKYTSPETLPEGWVFNNAVFLHP